MPSDAKSRNQPGRKNTTQEINFIRFKIGGRETDRLNTFLKENSGMSKVIDDVNYISSKEFKKGFENNSRKQWIRSNEAVKRYSLSRPTIVSIARDAGAVYKINGSLLIDSAALDIYLESFRLPGVVR